MANILFEPWNLLARRSRPVAESLILTAILTGCMAIMPARFSAAAGDDDVERFSATTTNLEPADVTLRFDVLGWSDEQAAAAVIAALEGDDIQRALDDVQTTGYIWPEGSPVGYSIKYAQRETLDSGERLTFVTSKALGSYDFGGWQVRSDAEPLSLDYSVIELDIPESGAGSGLMSLATPVDIDSENSSIRLDRDSDSTELLTGVRPLESGY